MVTISERKPKKIPGITSLFISIDHYDKNIGDAISSLSEVYRYDKKTKEYEVPIKNVSQLLDKISEFDDITLNSCIDEQHSYYNYVNKDSFKFKLFQHQVDAINYGCNKDKWLLLDDCGLGKTATAIYLAEELYRQGKLEHCLIICGVDSLRTNWKKEIEKFTNLSCMILGDRVTRKGTTTYEGVAYRTEQLKNKINEFFIITTITTIRDDNIVEAFNNSVNKIDMIVLDEAHRMKGAAGKSKSKQGVNLLELNAKYKLAMSGTLVVNNPVDMYAPLVWIGETPKDSLTEFKKYYCEYNEKLDRYDGFKNLDVLKEQLNTCSLRRLKTEVLKDLPEKFIIPQFLDMSDKQLKFYNEVLDGERQSVDKVSLSRNNLLGRIVRLRQATSCPQTLTSQEINSIKIDRCVEMVNDLVGVRSEKLVIFSGFKDVVYDLANQLQQYRPIVLTGDTSNEDFDKGYFNFQNNENEKLLIATYQKLGTGVNLNSARYLIFIDTPWTSSDFNQACDRVYRIGSNKTVFIYNLICNNTIDEKVWELVNYKQALSDFLIDDKIVNESALQSLQKYILDL